MFTQEEQQFLKNLLSQLQISPLAQDAEKTVSLVKGIVEKLAVDSPEKDVVS